MSRTKGNSSLQSEIILTSGAVLILLSVFYYIQNWVADELTRTGNVAFYIEAGLMFLVGTYLAILGRKARRNIRISVAVFGFIFLAVIVIVRAFINSLLGIQ